MRCCDRGAHIRERLTANRSSLTLQGGPNQHGTQKPRRTSRTNISPPRLELQNSCIPILRGHSTRPKGWVEILYFRSKAVLFLPVSTTSYSRHAVSTVQTWSAGPTTLQSSIDSDGAKTSNNPVLLPYLHLIIISCPVSNFHSLHLEYNNSYNEI